MSEARPAAEADRAAGARPTLDTDLERAPGARPAPPNTGQPRSGSPVHLEGGQVAGGADS